MRSVVAALAPLLALAGCLTPSGEIAFSSAPEEEPQAPETLTWSGFVLDSEVEGPSHTQPTEQALWPVMQEGFLLHVSQLPQAMEVSLDWEGAGEMMIMLHSHKAGGTNAYVEHITEMDDANPKCLRVPTADLAEGHWQIMVHSSGMRSVPFNLHVATWGGSAEIDASEHHGHWPQDGQFEVDEHPIEPCVAPSAA